MYLTSADFDYQTTFDECWWEGFRSFHDCPVWAQERLAKYYWLAKGKQQRVKFVEHIEEMVMDAIADRDMAITQGMLETALVEYYGEEIEHEFKQMREQAA